VSSCTPKLNFVFREKFIYTQNGFAYNIEYQLGVGALKVSFENGTYVCRCKFEERDIPRKAKFTYNPILHRWETQSLFIAARLAKHFDEPLKNSTITKSVEVKPWTGGISIRQGQTLEPYQLEAVKFALDRNNSYLALEQGLGKTPIAITIINSILKRWFLLGRAVVVVPPHLITNWVREIEAWGLQRFKFSIIRSEKDFETTHEGASIYIVPDTLLDKRATQIFFSKFDALDVLTVDEADRFNNDSKRTTALYDVLAPLAERKVWLSGTPMRSRPKELYPMISNLAHNVIGYQDIYRFGARYCNGFLEQVTKTKRRFNIEGSSREGELSQKLSQFMLVKKFDDHVDVDCFERVVVLDGKVTKKIWELEETVLKRTPIADLVGSKELGAIAAYRKELVDVKLPVACEWVETILKQTDESVIVFCIHQDMVFGLLNYFKDYFPVAIYGEVSTKDRDNIERAFMNGTHRLLIANVHTMVGLNLQRGSRGVFAESAWTPAANAQAVARMKRRGQTKKVLIDHLVLANTLDEYVLKRVLEKSKTIGRII